jgi:hypothetical protein
MTFAAGSASDTLSIISLVVGVVSVVATIGVGWFSIWLSLYFKREADAVNAKTLDLLIDVKTDAKIVSSIMAGELKSYGEASRQLMLGGKFSGTTGTLVAGDVSKAPVQSSIVITTPANPTQEGGSDAVSEQRI